MKRRGRPAETRTPQTYTVKRKVIDNTGNRNPAQPNLDWYIQPDELLYEQVFGRVRQLKNFQIARRYELWMYKQAYDGRFGTAPHSTLYSPGTRAPSAGQFGISANVIRSVIDTACAVIAKGKPRAFVLPNKGDYRLKRKCKKLTKFLDGAMAHANVYQNMDTVFRDSCIYGDGQIIVYPRNGAICSEAIKIDELHVDAVDGMYDQPKEMHWAHPMPRRELLELYPESEKEINEARSAWRGEMTFMGHADMVEVIYSWRLGPKGRRTVCIATKTLESEPYTKDYIPIVRFHYSVPTYGPFGEGIAKSLFGLQRTLSDVLRGIVKSIRMFAVPRVWVNKQAGVAQQDIGNEISVNLYQGDKPSFDTPPAASADIYAFVQWIIDYCYKQEGLSQLSANSEKPPGLNAAVALRTMRDIESQRFAITGQRWQEDAYKQVAEIVLDTAAELYKEKKNITVGVPGREFVERIPWSEVNMDRDLYEVGIWETNMLPLQPEGRLQAVTEYAQSGVMPREVIISELDNPILNDWISEETAPRDNIEAAIDVMLNDGRYVDPSPIGDLQMALALSQKAYLRADIDEHEPAKLEVLGRFITKCKQMIASMQPPAQPAPQGAPVGQAPPPPPAPLAPQGAGPVAMPAAA